MWSAFTSRWSNIGSEPHLSVKTLTVILSSTRTAWIKRYAFQISLLGHSSCWRWTHLHHDAFFFLLLLFIAFYIALFSALEQTHRAHWHVILNEWLYPFIVRIINIHGSGVLIALFGCCMAGAMWNAAVSAEVLCTPFNHAPGHSVTSFKAT